MAVRSRVAVGVLLTSLGSATAANAAVTWRGDFGTQDAKLGLTGKEAPSQDGWVRAERSRPLPAATTGEGAERFYAFSVFAEKALADVPHEIARFSSERSGKTLFALVARGERIDLRTYEPTPRGHYDGSTSRLRPGQWHTAIVRVLWSTDAARGAVDVFWDGDLMVHHAAGPTKDGNGRMVWGLGVSRPSSASEPAAAGAESVSIKDAVEATALLDVRTPVTPKAAGDFFSDVEFSRPAGVRLSLDAWVPKGKGPHAAVILVHGGGFIRGDRQSYVRPLFDLLADAGIAWFTIDYRLAPKHKWPAQLDDVESAVKWVHANARKYRIDPKRVALFGESASGFMVSALGVRMKKGGPLAAVLPFYSSHAFDLPKPGPDGKIPMPKRGVLIDLFDIKDTSSQTQASLRAAMPLYNVHADMPPFLIYHSDDDGAAPGSAKMCEAINAKGSHCDLFVSHGLGHGLGKWKDVPAETARLDAWLRDKLGVPPSRAARAQ